MVDLKKLVIVTAATHRPFCDYSKASPERLIFDSVAFSELARDLVTRIIYKPGDDPLKVAIQAKQVAYDPIPSLEHLYSLLPNETALFFLQKFRFELEGIFDEIAKRLEGRKAVLEFLRLKRPGSGPEDLKRFLKFLRVERVATSFRPEKEDPEDFKQIAAKAALEHYRKIRECVAAWQPPHGISLPFPEVLQLGNSEPWDRLNPVLFQIELKAARIFLPLLRGEFEKIPEKTRQALRGHWRKWRAKKRAGDETTLNEAKLPWQNQTPEALLEAKQTRDRQGRMLRSFAKRDSRLYFALKKHKGNKAKAAKELGISRSTLYKRLDDTLKKISD